MCFDKLRFLDIYIEKYLILGIILLWTNKIRFLDIYFKIHLILGIIGFMD